MAVLSEEQLSSAGAPQGYILSPLLYILFIDSYKVKQAGWFIAGNSFCTIQYHSITFYLAHQ